MFLTLRKSFLNAREGATMIEFAIAFPVFILFFLGIMEVALITFGNSVIENMMNQAARQGMVGCERAEIVGGVSGNMPKDCVGDYLVEPEKLKNAIAKKSFGLVNACSQDRFAFKVGPVTTNFDASGMGTINLGQGDEVIAYYARYNWPVLSPMLQLKQIFGDTMVFEYATVVRNERFGKLKGREMGDVPCGAEETSKPPIDTPPPAEDSQQGDVPPPQPGGYEVREYPTEYPGNYQQDQITGGPSQAQ